MENEIKKEQVEIEIESFIREAGAVPGKYECLINWDEDGVRCYIDINLSDPEDSENIAAELEESLADLQDCARQIIPGVEITLQLSAEDTEIDTDDEYNDLDDSILPDDDVDMDDFDLPELQYSDEGLTITDEESDGEDYTDIEDQILEDEDDEDDELYGGVGMDFELDAPYCPDAEDREYFYEQYGAYDD